VFKAGQRDLGLVLALRGELEVVEPRDGDELVLGTIGPREFLGDISMLTGTSALGTARGKADKSEILAIPADALRRALAELPAVSEPLVRAFIMRRKRLLRDREFAGYRLIALPDSREGHELRDFLDKNHMPHRVLSPESQPGTRLVERFHLGARDLPALVTSAGVLLRRPSLREAAQAAGLMRHLIDGEETEIHCDVAIVGAGPAGLGAAVYAASEGLKTIVLEGYAPGGQAGSSSRIENFFGFPTGISGGDLTFRAQLQAMRFGAKFTTPSHALSLGFRDGEFGAELQLEGCGASLLAKAVVIATGADYLRLDAEGRAEYDRAGVYYAATALEAQFCRGATVVVVGGGNSAGQAAMFLAETAAKVLLVIRGDGLAATMSNYLTRRVATKDNIEILTRTVVTRMTGGKRLECVELENTATGEKRMVETPGVFSMIGAKPCTQWLPPEIERDEKGFIKTGAAVAASPAWRACGRAPGPLETSQPGVFAAGDVRSGSVKRCAAAVGEGGMAIAGVHEALSLIAH
jgi:thioredoxin reductase (NADPH)